MLRFISVPSRALWFALLFSLLAMASQGLLHAQETADSHNGTAGLPSAPNPQQPRAPDGPQHSADAATLVGTVLDTNGAVVQSAHVQLTRVGAADTRSADTANDGRFSFEGLTPGQYKLTVSGSDMSTNVSSAIQINPGEFRIVPNVILRVSATTSSVTVTADKEELSVEQVQIAVQQRVFGVVPNFYSSFDWNAPPMLAKQKYKLGLRAAVDPVAFVVVGAIAGAEQYQNVFSGFGGGIEGYGKRYGATFANHVSAEFLSRALFPSIFHSDPRYFVMGSGSKKSRAWHAISSTFVTRGDDGSRKVNYSTILGELSSGALSNLYFPDNERGARLVYINGFSDIAGNAFDNLIREFVLNRFTSKAKMKQEGAQN